jgi:hypothetical protein
MVLILLQAQPEPKIRIRKILHSTLLNTRMAVASKEDSSQTPQTPIVDQTMEIPCFRLFMSQFSRKMLVIELLKPVVNK